MDQLLADHCSMGFETKFELWLIKFSSYIRVQKLDSVLDDALFDTASVEERTNYEQKNSQLFAHLVQFLDD